MSVKVGPNGLRFVEVEVEVPGSPEQVWEAIATGPGISSWFVPTTVEERVGGTMTADFGMGMESSSTISEWNPPKSFKKDGDGMDPDAPPVATEWIVEAKSGGTCVVRVVHSWFASTDEWDGQWEMVEQGWKSFFIILRLKLEHFAGQPCAAFDAAGMAAGPEGHAWDLLARPLGISEATEGQRVQSGSGAPRLAGTVSFVGHGESREVMVLADEPGTGICHVSAMPMGDQVYVSARTFLFGPGADATKAQAAPAWTDWFAAQFPMGG